MASGGMGKNELSTNETSPSSHVAYGLPAALTHQSYIFLSMGRLLAAPDRNVHAPRTLRPRSAALARAPAFERHHLAALARLDRALVHTLGQFGELLGHAE